MGKKTIMSAKKARNQWVKLSVKKILLVIFFLSLILRTWNLGTIPEAIDEDEMALGYYAYSLLKNGTDEYGKALPIYFESIGDYKYGVYSYFATIPISIFGLNPTSTRLTAALAGSLSVLVIYFLGLKVFKNERIALLSSALLAISPLHIHFSRVAYNNVLGLLFAMLSIYFLLEYLEKERLSRLIFSFFFFLLSIYTYQAFRIFMPLMVLLITVYATFKKIVKKPKVPLFFAIVVVVVVIVSLIPPESRARSQDISILIEQSKIIEQITEDSYVNIPILLTRILHNKLNAIVLGLTGRYISYFDPVFLFFNTSISSARHSIPEVGLMYLIELPFFVLAVFFYTKYSKTRFSFLPLLWILVGPLASAVVLEPRSPTRFVVEIIGFCMLIPIGVVAFAEQVWPAKKKFIFSVVFVLYFLNFFYVSHQYLVHKRYHHPWHGDVGLKEMVEAVTDKYYASYDDVVVSGGHYIPFLFYGKIHPDDFLESAEIVPKNKAKWNRVQKYDKFTFNMPHECPVAGKKNTLYVCFGYKVPINGKVIEIFRYRDGQPAVSLVEFVPLSSINEESCLPDRMEFMKDTDLRFEDNILPQEYESFWPV